jgi:hypothetical protein
MLSAEELLRAPHIGIVPLVSLARYEGSPEVLLRRCRDRIDREGGRQRENLLAVAQMFARLHFDRPEWLDILGGRKVMIESPIFREYGAECERAGQVEVIVHILQDKFGPVGDEISAALGLLKEKEKLLRLSLHAASCGSLQDFAERLRDELPKPAPASTRGKRRPRKPST